MLRCRSLINTIVFDLGGVLVDWNPRYLFRKMFTDELEMETFLKDVCNNEWNEKQDAGRPFSEAIQELSSRHPKFSPMIKAYWSRWPEMISGEIKGTVEIFNELKKSGRYKVFALSNWSAETFPLAQRRFQFLNEFDGVVLSGVEKMIKPDPTFFGLLTKRHGFEPSQAIFIDDVQKNIDAAQKLGFHTVLFRDPVSLRARLVSEGVL